MHANTHGPVVSSSFPRSLWRTSLRLFSVAALIVGMVVWTGCDSGGDSGSSGPASVADILQNRNLDTFRGLLQSTDQAQEFEDTTSTFMVFAPTNTAFETYDMEVLRNNSELLRSVINYHIVPDTAVSTDEMRAGSVFTTRQGDDVTVGSGAVEGTEIVIDAEGTNGVVHVLDNILLTNRILTDRLRVTLATQSFHQMLTDVGGVDVFADSNTTRTAFVPTDEALEKADLGGFSDGEVQQILQYHVLQVNNAVTSGALRNLLNSQGGSVSTTTVQGEDLKIALEDDQIVFNDGAATVDADLVDQRARNGIFHAIDGVLIPPSLQ